MVTLRPTDRGRWAITPANVAERHADLARLAALSVEARRSRQMEFDFDVEPDCERCGGDGEVDCPRCDGAGCAACDDHGRVDCTCAGGPSELEEDCDGPAL